MPQPQHFQGIFSNYMVAKAAAEQEDPTLRNFQEFPKHINRRDGSFVLVRNQREERDALAFDPTEGPELHPAEKDAAALTARLGEAHNEIGSLQAQLAEEREKTAKLMADMEARLKALETPVPPPVKVVGKS